MTAVSWPSIPSSSPASYQSMDDTINGSSTSSDREKSNPYGDCSVSDPIFHSSRVTFLNWSRTHPEDVYYWALRVPWIAAPISYFSITIAIMIVLVLIFTCLSWVDVASIALSDQPLVHPSFHQLFLYHFFAFTGGPTVASWTMNSGYLTAILSISSLARVVYYTIVTALLYARFARPISRIRFSANVVIGEHRGAPALMIRLANDRLDALLNSAVHLTLSYNVDGESAASRWRVYRDLEITRSGLPLFLLPWTVVHVIDQSSPLYGQNDAWMKSAQAELHVSISATDLVYAGTIHARKTYLPQSFRWRSKFADVITFCGDNHRVVDMKNMDKVEALDQTGGNVEDEEKQADEHTSLLVK